MECTGDTTIPFDEREEESRINEILLREERSPEGVKEFPFQRRKGNYMSIVGNSVAYSVRNGNMPMFALDKPTAKDAATKKYFVASYQDFFHHYVSYKKEDRSFYETVIPGLPCHLYIDLEFSREANPTVEEKKEKEIEDEFKRECFELFEEEFGIKKENIRLIALQSGNKSKFSKHYIFKAKDRMFKNNYHAGAFVRKLRNKILLKYGSNMLENKFFFKSKKAHVTKKFDVAFIADLGVYTMNRQWRVYGSTKATEYRPLFLENETLSSLDNGIDKDKLFDSFVQRITVEEVKKKIDGRPALQMLECFDKDMEEPVSSSDRYSYLPDGVPSDPFAKEKNNKEREETIFSFVKRSKKVKDDSSFNQFMPSDILDPLAAIEIANAVSKSCEGKREAGILTLRYYSKRFNTVKFDSSSRECAIRGAVHKSNHVWFRVNLEKFTFVQGCRDNDCNQKETSDMEVTSSEYPLHESARSVVDRLVDKKKEDENRALARSFTAASQFQLFISKSPFF
jgi:hypothetical protein